MDREELTGKLRFLSDCDTRPGRPLGDVMEVAADLIDQQDARIAELEADAAKAQEVQEEVYRIGRNHGWIAGWDAAANIVIMGGLSRRHELVEAIRALKTPEREV